MDKIKLFLQGLTFFQWLAIIAFLLGCISVTNAFLSLKSRFRNWRGLQNKKAFELRVKQLEKELSRLLGFIDKPKMFHQYLVEESVKIVQSFFIAFTCLVIAVGMALGRGYGFHYFFIIASFLTMAFTIASLAQLKTLARRVYDPAEFAVDLIKFKVDAQENGFTLEDHGTLMTFLKEIKTKALASST